MGSTSHSEVESYLTCKRKHYYGYGLSLQRQTEGAALALGSAGHEVLDAYYSTILAEGDTKAEQHAAIASAEAAALDKYAELVEGGYEDLDDRKAPLKFILFDWYFPNEPLVKEGFLIQAVETEFVLEYDTEAQLRFPIRADLIVVSPEGKTVIVDHKFVGQFYSDTDTELMGQVPKYIGGLRALGYRVDEGAYNMIKTTRIVGAKLTKAELVETIDIAMPGQISGKETVAQLTDVATHLGVSVSAGPTLEQMLKWLPIKPNVPRVQQTFIEQIEVAAEIEARKALSPEDLDRVSFRVANKMVCNGCSFRDLCSTELSGGNTKLMMKSEYRLRERKVFDEVSEEVA